MQDLSFGGICPNPFGSLATIGFHVRKLSEPAIRILDTGGREVRVLAGSVYPPGKYQVTWDGKDHAGNAVPDGLYFVRMESGNYDTRRLLLLR